MLGLPLSCAAAVAEVERRREIINPGAAATANFLAKGTVAKECMIGFAAC